MTQPLRRLASDRILAYSGTTLGKRPHQRYVRPPPAKRRCLPATRYIRQRELDSPLLSQLPPYPSHIVPYPTPDPPFQSLTTTFFSDPDLSLLTGLRPADFARIIWPPNPLPPQMSEYPYGNDNPGGCHQDGHPGRDMIHPLFRHMLLPFGRFDHGSNSYQMHYAYPLLWHALQLATRFLSNRDSLQLFHRLLFEQPQRLKRESDFYGADMWHFPQQQAFSNNKEQAEPRLTEQQRILTTDTLAALAPHISICFASSEHDANTWAHTTRISTQDPTPTYQRRLNKTFHDAYQDSSTGAALRAQGKSTLPYSPPILQPLAPTPASISRPNPETLDFVMETQDHNLIYTRAVSLHQQPDDAAAVPVNSQTPPTPLFRGTNARITLSPLFLRYLHRDSTPPVPYHGKVYILFFLAVTLVHEVAHAVWLCRVAPPRPPPLPLASAPDPNGMDIDTPQKNSKAGKEYEPFVNNDRKPELGRAWETSVFGGIGCVEPLGQLGAAGEEAVEWGDLFMMGLGVRAWPDEGEGLVRVDDRRWRGRRGKGRVVVPLARLYQAPDETGDYGDGDGVGGEDKDEDGAMPEPLSGPEYTYLRILPFEFVYKFFDCGFWEWVDGREEGLRELLRGELDGFVQVKRENVDWMCVDGARAVDLGEDEDEEEQDLDDDYEC